MTWLLMLGIILAVALVLLVLVEWRREQRRKAVGFLDDFEPAEPLVAMDWTLSDPRATAVEFSGRTPDVAGPMVRGAPMLAFRGALLDFRDTVFRALGIPRLAGALARWLKTSA